MLLVAMMAVLWLFFGLLVSSRACVWLTGVEHVVAVLIVNLKVNVQSSVEYAGKKELWIQRG